MFEIGTKVLYIGNSPRFYGKCGEIVHVIGDLGYYVRFDNHVYKIYRENVTEYEPPLKCKSEKSLYSLDRR